MNWLTHNTQPSKEDVLEAYKKQPLHRYLAHDIWDQSAYYANPEFDFELSRLPESEQASNEHRQSVEKSFQDPVKDLQGIDTGYISSYGQSWELNNGPWLRLMVKPDIDLVELRRVLKWLADHYQAEIPVDPQDDEDAYRPLQASENPKGTLGDLGLDYSSPEALKRSQRTSLIKEILDIATSDLLNSVNDLPDGWSEAYVREYVVEYFNNHVAQKMTYSQKQKLLRDRTNYAIL